MNFQIVDEARFAQLVDKGEIAHDGCRYLDGLKVGLRIGLVRRPDATDDGEVMPSTECPLPMSMRPGEFHLGITKERLAISPRLFGWMHTRSTWARRGLDCLRSSSYIAPGYGYDAAGPLPLTLELSTHTTLRRFPPDEPVAAFILFELERAVRPSRTAHTTGRS